MHEQRHGLFTLILVFYLMVLEVITGIVFLSALTPPVYIAGLNVYAQLIPLFPLPVMVGIGSLKMLLAGFLFGVLFWKRFAFYAYAIGTLVLAAALFFSGIYMWGPTLLLGPLALYVILKQSGEFRLLR